MRLTQVRDMLDQVRELHGQLAEYYGQLSGTAAQQRLKMLLDHVDLIVEQKWATVLRLAEGVNKNPGKIPGVSNAAESSALVS